MHSISTHRIIKVEFETFLTHVLVKRHCLSDFDVRRVVLLKLIPHWIAVLSLHSAVIDGLMRNDVVFKNARQLPCLYVVSLIAKSDLLLDEVFHELDC